MKEQLIDGDSPLPLPPLNASADSALILMGIHLLPLPASAPPLLAFCKSCHLYTSHLLVPEYKRVVSEPIQGLIDFRSLAVASLLYL